LHTARDTRREDKTRRDEKGCLIVLKTLTDSDPPLFNPRAFNPEERMYGLSLIAPGKDTSIKTDKINKA